MSTASGDEYYMQDKRTYVGNDILWWAKDGKGYTTNLLAAHVFTKQEAINQNNCRDSDIPWPKAYVDGKTRPAVDMQYVDVETALEDTGIVLSKPTVYKEPQLRCYFCAAFMSRFNHTCRKCGESNMP